MVFHLLRNRYEHLRHVGSAGSAIAFSSRRKNELFVALADGTVRVPQHGCLPYPLGGAQPYAVLRVLAC